MDPLTVLDTVRTAPDQVRAYLDGHVWWILAVAAFAAAVWAAAAGWWRRRAAVLLADRVGFDLLPSGAFEVREAEVRWFAGQVASVRSACGMIPRRAAGTRVRITCVDGLVRYQLEGPARAANLLGLPGYRDVDVAPVGSRGQVVVAEPVVFEGVAPVVKAVAR